jgi:PKD repeat protein
MKTVLSAKTVNVKHLVLILLVLISGFEVLSVPMVRLKMKGLVNSNDETIVYYQQGATNGFDASYDAYKILGPNPAPHIYQVFNTTMINTNGITPVSPTFSILVKATTHITGNFTITAEDTEELPVGTCVTLKDLSNGMSYDMLTNSYVFLLKDTTSAPRFVLFISQHQLGYASSLTAPSCQSPNTNKFKIGGNSNGPWNYTWKDSAGTTIQTTMNSFLPDSMTNLVTGIYTVSIVSGDGCYSNNKTFTVVPKTIPSASFSAPDTIFAGSSFNYQPVNQSTDCAAYSWNFGNGSNCSAAFQPQHSYTVQGLYSVKLVGTSTTGCKDSIVKTVKVMDIMTYIKNEFEQSVSFSDKGNNQYNIHLNKSGELNVRVISMEGKILLEEKRADENILLDLGNLSKGLYVVSMDYKGVSGFNEKVIVR